MTMTSTFGPDQLVRLQRDHPEVRLIDVRTPAEFASGHIAGSYNVPLPDLGEHRAELTAAAAGPVVITCQSGRRAEAAQRQLADAGLLEVRVLNGGVNAWSAAGLELQRLDSAGGWTIERQVRGLAGGIVLASILLSLIWPEARFLAGAIGAGLLFAAITDTCAMGMLLSRMPWNRRNAATCDMPTVVASLTSADISITTNPPASASPTPEGKLP